MRDLQGFIEDGGWGTVLRGSDDEADNEIPDGEEDDSEFTPGENVI